MTSLRAQLRLGLTVALALTTGLASAAQAVNRPHPQRPAAPRLGPNLAPNPSFEQSSLDAATQQGIPVTPVGWSFEGSTVLFDYNQRGGHTGSRQVAISGTLGGGTQVCDHSSGSEVCAANPGYSATHAVDQATVGRYSVRPVWRNATAIPVTAGKTYRFSVWAILVNLDPNAGVPGQGAATRIRWVDAGGNAVSVVDGAALVKGPHRLLGFHLIGADLTAPAGATGAVLMLGHTDYTHTGAGVAFDDVSLNQYL